MAQSGDFINKNGSSGESIYGPRFDDENFTILHEIEGRLGMANAGPNTNSSQFYITTVPCTHLDRINVVFGQVRKGLNIIREMGQVPKINDVPTLECIIEDCGELKPGEPWNICDYDCTEDIYPPWPQDWDLSVHKNREKEIETAINCIKNSGNYFFKQQNYHNSDRKYRKALRYIDWLTKTSKNTNKKKVNEMQINSLLNLAAVRLKNNKYQDVIKLCDQVLSIVPNCGKALFRKAQAEMGMKDYDEALVDLRKVLDIFPNDKHVQMEMLNAKKKKMNYLEKEKVIFAKMFQCKRKYKRVVKNYKK